MKYARRITCLVGQDVQLEIATRTGDLAPTIIADMLAAMLERYRGMRELSPDLIFDGHGLGVTWKIGRRIVGRVCLSCPNGPLPVKALTEAAVKAYVCVNSVEQIDESLGEWKLKTEYSSSGYVREVIRRLETRDILGAIVAMAEQKRSKPRVNTSP